MKFQKIFGFDSTGKVVRMRKKEEERKKHELEIMDYHGTSIIGRDYDVLMEIDKKTGEIPTVS